MFLMFNLNRPDIFPIKDIVTVLFQKNYKTSYPPSKRFKKISNLHSGYRTVAHGRKMIQ